MDETGAAGKPARKRPASAKAAPARKRPPTKAAAAEPAPEPGSPKRRRLAIAVSAFALVGAAFAASALVYLRDDAPPDVRAGVPVVVSAGELAAYSADTGVPVYWAGPIEDRRLELTRTSRGTFVRYLAPGVSTGAEKRALTIATYPLANAFATATARAGNAQMASARVARGGLAVWSRARPTSVYLAFPDARQLVEIYSPDAGQAMRLARSGHVAAVG